MTVRGLNYLFSLMLTDGDMAWCSSVVGLVTNSG